MNPTDLLFQTFNNFLTGGVITDLTTALVGMVVLMVLVLGGSKLISIFDQYQHNSSNENEDDSEGSFSLSRRKDREDD